MGLKIIRVTSSKSDALRESKSINKDLKERGIKRESRVIPISRAFVKRLTRKGFIVKKKNFAIAIRRKK